MQLSSALINSIAATASHPVGMLAEIVLGRFGYNESLALDGRMRAVTRQVYS